MTSLVRAATLAAPAVILQNQNTASPNITQLLTMLSDRTTLVFAGPGFSAGQIVVSTDGGATLVNGYSWGSQWTISGLIETGTGEVLVAITSRSSDPGQIWRSTGWNKATGTATTWTQVLTSSGSGVTFDGRWSLTPRSLAPSWSARPGALYVAEYGTKINAASTPTQAAIRAWTSRDDGVTWTQIFDLRDRYPGLVAQLHIHAIAYDPYDDRVIITQGDGGYGDGGMAGVWVCNAETIDSGNPVWSLLPGTQSTSAATQVVNVIPVESGLIFLSDGTPQGVRRVSRRGFRRYGRLIDVLPLPGSAIGAKVWQNPDAPGAPIFLTYQVSSGTASVIYTLDGETFIEAFRDTTSISGGNGITLAVGPDLAGKVWANNNSTGATVLNSFDWLHPTVAPAPITATGVLSTRQISTGPGLGGGGDLTVDRILALYNADAAATSGLIAHAYPAHLASSTTAALTSGTLYLVRVTAEDAAAAATRTVRFWQNTASSGLTLAKAAVYDSAGTLLGSSADASSTLNGSGTAVRNLTVGSFALTKGAVYYLALLVVGTTGPILLRTSNSGVANAGLSGAALLWSTGGTGLADVPASVTPGSLSAQPVAMWFGLL